MICFVVVVVCFVVVCFVVCMILKDEAPRPTTLGFAHASSKPWHQLDCT